MSWGGSEKNPWFNSTDRLLAFSMGQSEHTDQNVELNQQFFSEPPQLIIEIVITWCYRKPFHNTEILSHSSTWRLKRISNFLHFTYLSLHIDTTLVLPLIIVIFHLHSTQMILRQLLHPTKPNGLESFEGRLTGKNVTGEG